MVPQNDIQSASATEDWMQPKFTDDMLLIYRGLYNQSHDAIFVIDLQGNYLQANQRAMDLLGYDNLDEIRQLNLEIVSDEFAESQKMLTRLLAGDYIPAYERRFRRKDGTLMFGEINAELVRDDEGKPHHIQSVVRDIGPRKQTEETLRRQNDYLSLLHRVTLDLLNRRNRDDLLNSIINHVSAILDVAFVEILLKDGEDMVTVACTPNIRYLLGDRGKHTDGSLVWQAHDTRHYATVDNYSAYSARNPIYGDTVMTAVACFPIMIGDECVGVLDATRSELGRPFSAEEIQQGTVFAQLVALLLDNLNSHEAAAHELERRKQVDASLQASEERQRALLNAIPDLIFRYDKNGNFLDYHSTDVGNLAVPPEQFLGRNIADVMPAPIVTLHNHHMENVFRTGREAIYEYSLMMEQTPAYFEARMVLSGQDEVLTIVRDITERKLLEDQTYALVMETARANVLGQFVQNASHELRTPLSVINTNLYLMNRSADESKRQLYADRVAEQVNQLAHLVDMVLMMTKLDSDIELNKQTVDLNDWIHRVVDASLQAASEKGLTIRFNRSELPEASVDYIWLQEAFGQLLDNAIRFTAQDGWIEVRTFTQDNYIVVEIQDNGIGIPADSIPHIFDRFWRQDEAHSTPGFGLGLALAHKIVEMHDGRIAVDSKVGVGSTFRISLPITPYT